MRLNLTVDRRTAFRATVGWVRDVLRQLLGEQYGDLRRHEVAASDFEGRSPRAETVKAERGARPVPFVEAAKNLVRAVITLDDGARQVEPVESLARRIRSWEKFERAARQWCVRHSRR
jgi:hypothetical protein